jgi:two-component system, OmpR family, sensor kinase
MSRVRVPRSIRGRLTLLFVLITGAAIAGMYLYVVPRLESRLVAGKLEGLEASLGRYGGDVARAATSDATTDEVGARVREAAASAAARVALLRVNRSGGRVRTEIVADSAGRDNPGDIEYPSALAAARRGQVVRTTEATGSGRWAEAARPIRATGGRTSAVVVLAAPLADVQRDVDVVSRQILVAGAIALLFALLAGYVVARALSDRIRRLERAAESIAAGDFDRPIPVDSDDELGQLTKAFNDMQRQLAQVDRARKSFIATASHELRTPIFSLGGFVELLEDEDLDEEDRRRFVDQLGEQVERLRKLSVDLLDLSKLESGSLELRPEPVDVPELVRAVAAEFEPALARHDSHLSLRLGAGGTEAVCDPVRIAQVLRILIDNALTHTVPGTDISVTTQRQDGHMRLAVRDAGDGLPHGDLERIFDPFVTSNGAQGSGLGLAIARELAGAMRGRLDVESRPGRTTFSLEVPA